MPNKCKTLYKSIYPHIFPIYLYENLPNEIGAKSHVMISLICLGRGRILFSTSAICSFVLVGHIFGEPTFLEDIRYSFCLLHFNKDEQKSGWFDQTCERRLIRPQRARYTGVPWRHNLANEKPFGPMRSGGRRRLALTATASRPGSRPGTVEPLSRLLKGETRVLFSFTSSPSDRVCGMRLAWCKRPLLTLGGLGLVYCLSLFLGSGDEQRVMVGTDFRSSRMVGSLLDLEANVSHICEFRGGNILLRLQNTSEKELG